jgi:glycerol uptake facilitator-like aquaporin
VPAVVILAYSNGAYYNFKGVASLFGNNLPQLFSEFVATFGLLAVIWGCARLRSTAVPFAVGAYIMGCYWFTASTSFANPAVTLARAVSDTFAGIRPVDLPGFIVAQLAGAAAATALFRWLVPSLARDARDVVVAHPSAETDPS